MVQGRKKIAPRNKARPTTKRRSSYAARKSSKSLKSYKIFSPITLVIIVLLVVIAALISAYQTGGTNSTQAATLQPVNTIGAGLVGYTATANPNPIGARLRLVGTGLTGVRTLQVGGQNLAATVTANSNGSQTVTAALPTSITNSSAQVDALPKDAAGTTVGNITGISAVAAPTISSVSMSGNSAVITGTGITPGSTVRLGRYSGTATLIGTDANGNTELGVVVNTNSCLLSSIPVLNRFCHNAGVGNNAVQVTSGGITSNTLNVHLAKSNSTSSAATVATLGSTTIGQCTSVSCGQGSGGGVSLGGGSGSSGQGTPDACGPGATSTHGAGYVLSNAGNATGGTVNVLSPKSGDVWNIGSPQAFTWVNPGTQITPKANGSTFQSSAFAQVSLVGTGGSTSCIHYNLQHYLDLDPEGAAAAHAADGDNDLCPANVVSICSKAWNENEDSAPGCGTSNDGTDPKLCDNPGEEKRSEGFSAWGAETDTQDQDGMVDSSAGGKILCFAVLPGNTVEGTPSHVDPNVGTPGATVSVTVSGCQFGRPPAGQYKAYVQVYGLSGPTACTPGHRCIQVATRAQVAAYGYSANFTIN